MLYSREDAQKILDQHKALRKTVERAEREFLRSQRATKQQKVSPAPKPVRVTIERGPGTEVKVEEHEYVATIPKQNPVNSILDVWEEQGVPESTLNKFKKTVAGKSSSEPPWRGVGEHKACPFDQEHPCCKKPCKCYEYFQNEVATWREQLVDFTGGENQRSREEVKSWVINHRKKHPMPGYQQGRTTRHYCNEFMYWWTGLSKHQFYPDVRVSGLARGKKAQAEISIMAWFQELIPTLECMPDSRQYHVAAPHWKDVYRWYMADQGQCPTVLKACTKQYFNKIRRKWFPHVKLRKVLRFSKCETCVTLREKCWDRKSSREARADARVQLEEHYHYVKQERAEALRKAYLGVLRPNEVLSMAIDGTSQLVHGIPQFSEKVCVCVCVCVCVF